MQRSVVLMITQKVDAEHSRRLFDENTDENKHSRWIKEMNGQWILILREVWQHTTVRTHAQCKPDSLDTEQVR